MFAATLGAGVLAALATFLAVWLTNKKTVENYEKEINRQRAEREMEKKEKAMVILKPMILRNTFNGILDMIIMRNSLDRILLFSGDDGFDFVNHSTTEDDGNRYAPRWRFMFIENESTNDIHFVKLTTHSRLETNTKAKINYSTSNFLNLLRSKESIAIRFESLEQHEKLNEASEFYFEASFEYLTTAKQQVCYKYEVKVKNSETEILKDEYTITENITLPSDCKTTVYRNLQDDIAFVDRSAYAWEKIGAAQFKGFGYNTQPSRPSSSDVDALIKIAEGLAGVFISSLTENNPQNNLENEINNIDEQGE